MLKINGQTEKNTSYIDNMKPPQGVLILGWIILCSSVVFLFNEQLQYQFPVQTIVAPKIANSAYVVSGPGSKKYSRCFDLLK